MDLKLYSKEIHKPVRKPTAFRKIITNGIDDIWAIDLVDMRLGKSQLGSLGESQKAYIAENGGNGYIMTCIDCFSRYLWAIPMKTNDAKTSLEAFKKILSGKRKPTELYSDQGGEFKNKLWDTFLAQKGIGIYSTFGQHKASIIERANRTLKEAMWRTFTEKQDRTWINILPGLVDDYNHKKHSAIKMTPIQASLQKNEKALWEHQYGDAVNAIEGVPKYQIGDWVRVSRLKGVFEKGFDNNWSFEVFKIVRISLNEPVMYYLDDWYGEHIKGGFYENEVQKTAFKDVFLIDKDFKVKHRTVKGVKQTLVKYVGYKEPYWTNDSEVEDLVR